MKIVEYKFGKDVTHEFVKEKLNWNTKHFVKIGKKYAKLSTLKQKICYVCNGDKRHKVSNFYGVNYVQCKKCNHVYTDRRLSDLGLKKYYSEDKKYFNEAYTKKSILDLRKKIFLPKIKFVNKYTKGKNWLDVGSGDGTAVAVANSSGYRSVGIEISDTGRKFAKKFHKVELYDKPLENFVLENSKKWNVISFFGVLEHVTNPTQMIRLSNSLLEKHGIIALELPNYNSLSTYVQKLSKIPDRHLIPYAHIMLYTVKSAKYILEKNGFKPIAIWFYGMDMIEFLKHVSRQDKYFAESELSNLLIKKLNKMQLSFDEDEMGDQFLIIGKKIKNI